MKQKKEYQVNGVRFIAKNRRTAKRRYRGWERGEMDADGRTIPLKDRKKNLRKP